MGNFSGTINNVIFTDAGFRTFGNQYSAMLAQIGLVKISDSGQVNWTTATAPWDGAYPYYEIWSFPASATQTNSPIYFKVFYGINAGTGIGSTKFRIGTSWSDGGVVPAIYQTDDFLALSRSLNGVTFVASCDGHGLQMQAVANNTSGLTFAIDRPRNPTNGQPLEDCIYVYQKMADVFTPRHGYFDFVANEYISHGTSNIAPCVMPLTPSPTLEMTNSLGQTQICPWWIVMKNMRGVSKMMASYHLGDLTTNILTASTHDFEFLGAVRKYKTLGTLRSIPANINGGEASSTADCAAVAVWWED